jgi:Arc/MetJ family transcription regulator
MRTNIEIDDQLMRRAMAATNTTTKKAAVEASLRLAVRLKAQEGIKKWRGKIQWEGDLAASREGRFLDWDDKPKGEKRGLSVLLERLEK